LEDHDEQEIDSLFGLGLLPPDLPNQSQKGNLIRWVKEAGYVKKSMASIYIENYKGLNPEKALIMKDRYDLPDSYLRFGDYSSVDIV